MKVNIVQAVRRIKGRPDFFRPLYESIINSIQAEADIIKISFQIENIEDEESDYNIIGYDIWDNGHGFKDEDIDAFLTLYTDRNSDKGALGSGRILCLKVFENIEIVSQTKNIGNTKGKETKIDFNVNFNFNSIEEIDSKNKDSDISYTIVKYKNLKPEYKNKRFIPNDIKENIFIELLPLFIEYNKNNKDLTIYINNEKWIDKNSINDKISEYSFEEETFSLSCDNTQREFKLYYRICNDANKVNRQFYAAAYRKIKDFPNDTKVNNLPDNPSIIFCLTSDYFKEIVDDSREDFVISINQNNPTDEAPITIPAINTELKKILEGIIIKKFPNIKDDFNLKKDRIINENPYLTRYVKEIEDFTKNEDEIKKEAEKLFNNSSKKIKERVKKFSDDILQTRNFQKDRYIEITKEFTETGQEQLAHYFAYRQVIIEMLKNIYEVNTNKDAKDKFDEGEIHDLIMPKKTENYDSNSNIVQNNFWLFDDKFMTFNFAASDSTMKKLRDALKNEKLDEIPQGYEEDRPDILVLYSDDEKSDSLKDVVIVELKKIGVGAYDKSKALDQLVIYANIFRKIMTSKIKDIFVYSFFEFDAKIEELLRIRGYQPDILSANGHKLHYYYSYNAPVGAYINVLSFESVIFTANRRNKLFLNILTGKIK